MPASDIVVQGAREHNLRDVNLAIPRNRLVCLTGVSGSGKSSLAFDTLYAEGQRRYVESLSSFARQFLGQMPKPDVDFISGLSPSISISQKSSGQNPRSTVGTITEIYDYLRVLYARCGQGHCPQCSRPITAQSPEQIVDQIADGSEGTRLMVLAPVVRAQKGEHRDLFIELIKKGFARARVDGQVVQLSDDLRLDRKLRHNIEVVIDRLVLGAKGRVRLAEAVELALKLGEGNLIVAKDNSESVAAEPTPAPSSATAEETEEKRPRVKKRRAETGTPGDRQYSADYACTHCGISFDPPTPQLFSFNSPQGMCRQCDGLGELYSFVPEQLVTNPAATFKGGCIEVIGSWRSLGRWKRHIYQGVAEALERKFDLPSGTVLDTPWQDLDERLRHALLRGTGDLHITFKLRRGGASRKYGGKFEGIIPELLGKYRQSNSIIQQRYFEKYMSVLECTGCHGSRLNRQAESVTLTSRSPHFHEQPERSLPQVCSLAVNDAAEFFSNLELSGTSEKVAGELVKEVTGRLGFLTNVGLEYLSLNRTAPTLSGGESQRIRLAGQIGCGLVGVLYILDEPSIGLHPRDNDKLLTTLTQLRDKGNTVVVVEHDEDTMRAADHLIDFGPGPGVRGGEVVASGSLKALTSEPRSITGQFLSGKRQIEIPATRRPLTGKMLKVLGARHNNLRDVDAEIPLSAFVCVTGASGSGKSSLVSDILVEALRRDLNGGEGTPGEHDKIEGLENLDKLIAIDQSPIGRTPRSNPATYIKVFDEIRNLYVQLEDSKTRGYKPGRFSFNVAGGRCEACEGNGSNRLEMDFLADVWVTCPICQGKRFNRETLQIKFKGKSIADVLEMDIQQALEHFENVPHVYNKLKTLHDVGLDYLKLGQPSPTLSGGEAQRVKLARELTKKSTGRTLYLLDEPTTGLHFADIQMLLKVLHDFVNAGNTVLVVEHNLDVVKTADWIIDLGPEGGRGGGEIIASGTPEQVAQVRESHTGRALKAVLDPDHAGRTAAPKKLPRVPEHTSIRVRGASQHNLKGVDVEIPRDSITVCCGKSGSGKSSLAMDTIYAEGQRRYVESLSSYARQFVGQMQKPKLEHIEGLSPAIAIEQKHLGHTPRSTVGTVTEIYDYLRILLARLGTPHCPACDVPIGTQTPDEITDKVMALPEGTKLYLLAPMEIHVGERYETLWDEIRARGYPRMRVNGVTCDVDSPPTIDRRRKHTVEVVVDRITVRAAVRSRIAESIEAALSLGRGVMHVAMALENKPESQWPVVVHSQHFACDRCGRSFEPLTPHSFSFNSPLGWCPSCEGLGTQIGANPAALLRDGKLTLAEGAVKLWPAVPGKLFNAMLAALSAHTGIPLDMPFERLTTRHRRTVLYGTGEDWIDVKLDKSSGAIPTFRFQFKGLYPALEEAAKLSQGLRARLDHLVDEVDCSTCDGSRLRDDAAAVRLRTQTIHDLCRLPLGDLLATVQGWNFNKSEQKVAGELVREIISRVQFLVDVGLEYLTISRPAPTLSGGESQRIRLASQVGSGLCGVLYVLDEPTIGLHPRDNRRLIGALQKLRDLGNTLLIVEHDRDVVNEADQLLDFGPGAGEYGGEIVARGTPAQVAKARDSVTGPYLSGKKAIAIPSNRRVQPVGASATKTKKPAKTTRAKTLSASTDVEMVGPQSWIEIIGARHNNLRNIDVRIPLGTLTAVTGVSGSGKSSLVEDVLYNSLARTLHRARLMAAAHEAIRGVSHINKVIRVDQQSLGNTPTSNPVTYTGAFELIRNLFAQLPEAKVRGYTPRRFSFNAPGGRCETCEGNGQKRIEMHFLPDVWVECDICQGQRYNPETLSVKFHGNSISDVLNMSCRQALRLFDNIPKIRRILQTLCDVGLDYLKLGQPAPTLSGGEAQRVKLAAELARPDTGRTLYLLDEPTTGLHFDDLAKLLEVLHRLVDLGNTVVVIEHNLDVIKTADWVVEIGPEAGIHGGQVVASGTPEQLVAHAERYTAQSPSEAVPAKKTRAKKTTAANEPTLLRCHTGEALAPVLASGPYAERKLFDFAAAEELQSGDMDIDEVGAAVQMPWEEDGRRWHTVDRVARNGEPCKWDGQILGKIVDKIHKLGKFSETNWNSRGVVEISAEKKSEGWFFHAITGEPWVLKLKFRVAKNTFKREDLTTRLKLAPLDDLEELPVYGAGGRVKCKNLRGPWQEVQVLAHSLEEIDTPEFWKFIEQAVAGFNKFTERVQQKPEDVMPWRVLGRKWHFSRRGFPPGKSPAWDAETLEELFETLLTVAPKGQVLWNNQQLVHVFVAGQREPWATVHTKRLAGIDLVLNGKKDAFALGRLTGLGADRDLDVSQANVDQIKLQIINSADLRKGDLPAFLSEHLTAALGTAKKSGMVAAL